MPQGYVRFAVLTAVLTLCVIVFGAYVRLSDAGLSCPDWPGCYGAATVPASDAAVAEANARYPERPVEVGKAWKEMIHRYLAGALGVCILLLTVVAWRRRDRAVMLPTVLLLLVILQALLGMWTVTLQLKPVVVTGHLLGGMATLGLLWWLVLREGRLWLNYPADEKATSLKPWIRLGIAVLIGQLTLGGWTSANYAALACPDFPLCQGRWWPEMNLPEAFRLWRGLGVSYEHGVLGQEALTGVHMMHRLGALVTFAYIGGLSVWVLARAASSTLAVASVVVILLLLLQIALGVATVLWARPLAFAVAHNGVAALLLVALLTQVHLAGTSERDSKSIAR